MWAAAIPSLIQAGSQILSKGIAADAATANGMPASGMLSMGSGLGGMFSNIDNSGWTVATSGSTAKATAGDRGGQSAVPPAAFTAAAGGAPMVAGSAMDPTAMLVVGAIVIAVLLTRKHK